MIKNKQTPYLYSQGNACMVSVPACNAALGNQHSGKKANATNSVETGQTNMWQDCGLGSFHKAGYDEYAPSAHSPRFQKSTLYFRTPATCNLIICRVYFPSSHFCRFIGTVLDGSPSPYRFVGRWAVNSGLRYPDMGLLVVGGIIAYDGAFASSRVVAI